MRLLILAGILAAAMALPARADNSPTKVSWKGWTVISSEALWRGRKHREYPLTYLFDNDPNTAWVFSGTHPEGSEAARYSLTLWPEQPVAVDEVRIMNGYNKSRETFLRNDRVVEMRVLCGGEEPVRATLPDTMGWHSVKLPPGSAGQVTLEFTRLKKGADDDLCISGLELWSMGRKLDLGIPQAVIHSDGGEDEGNTSYLMSRDGNRVMKDEAGPYDSGGAVWSSSGKHVASLQRNPALRFWMADATTGKMLLTRPVPEFDSSQEYEIEWSSASEVRLKVLYHAKDGLNKDRVFTYRVPTTATAVRGRGSAAGAARTSPASAAPRLR